MGFCSFILKAPVQCLGIFTPTLVEMAITNFLCSTSVQFSRSVMSDFLQPMDCSTLQASLSITNSQSLLKLMSIGLVMSSNHLILCHPLLLLTSIFPSIKVFSNESVLCIRWPKYWSFSFSISPSNEYSGLISLRMDWLDILVVQGTLKVFSNTSSKASILQCSAFFIVQLEKLNGGPEIQLQVVSCFRKAVSLPLW